jgi:hypothetical protein
VVHDDARGAVTPRVEARVVVPAERQGKPNEREQREHAEQAGAAGLQARSHGVSRDSGGADCCQPAAGAMAGLHRKGQAG